MIKLSFTRKLQLHCKCKQNTMSESFNLHILCLWLKIWQKCILSNCPHEMQHRKPKSQQSTITELSDFNIWIKFWIRHLQSTETQWSRNDICPENDRNLADVVKTSMVAHGSNHIESTQGFSSAGSHLLLQFTTHRHRQFRPHIKAEHQLCTKDIRYQKQLM